MTERIREFDLLRGTLVLGMILVHALEHIGRAGVPEILVLWVSMGFVFMSGMLGSSVLVHSKHPGRIVWRGAKLILLFLVLNLLLNGPASVTELVLHGNIEQSTFEILLPIGLVIVLLPVLSIAPLFTGIIGLLCIASLDILQFWPYLLKFLAVGCVGVAAGRVPHVWKRWYDWNGSVLAGSLIAALVLLSFTAGWQHARFSSALVLWVSLVPLLLTLVLSSRPLDAWLSLLGRHSLLLYITHVAVIALAARVHPPFIPALVVLLLGCTVLAWVVDRQGRFPGVQRVYRVVFR